MANEQDRGDRKRRSEGRGRSDRGPKGRGDRRGRPGDRRGGKPEPAAGAHRVLFELPILERALTKSDLAAQKEPLESIRRALAPLRLTSVEQLDPNVRGRLITSLLRVARQPKPETASEPATERAAEPSVEPATEPSAEAVAQPAEEQAPTAEAAAQEALEAQPSSEEPAQPPPSAEAKTEAPQPAQLDPRLAAYQEVHYLLGSIWKALGDERRAALEFAASGRKEERAQAAEVLKKTGDWRQEAQLRKDQGRTRDAARILEKQGELQEAGKLYEDAGDLKGALRAALSEKNLEAARKLLAKLDPAQAQPILERAGAFELLMERFIEAKDFENVARLYERARQFDQAALAWERAGKLSMARKAFERAKDPQGAKRMRELEVALLLERGDRLGAAVLQVSAGQRQAAVEILSALPGTKAFRFMQKARLDKEALEFAQKEIEKATQEGRMADLARWLEMTGEATAAGEAWEKADRKDKAMLMYEQAGHWQKAAELAEATGQLDKAVQLFHRAADKANADRVAQLARQPKAEAKPTEQPGSDS